MEGTASYGAPLARILGRADITMVDEIKPPRKQAEPSWKSDEIDATAAATGVLVGAKNARVVVVVDLQPKVVQKTFPLFVSPHEVKNIGALV